MRIAVLYDIHGNLPALNAVLADVGRGGADLLVVGGDVYPGPMAGEALDALLSCGIPYRALSGNGERAVLETIGGKRFDSLPAEVLAVIDWSAATIDPAHEREIRAWPAIQRIDIPGVGRAAFVHATARNDVEIFTERTADDDVRSKFEGIDADVVFCGHTHMQFDRRIGDLRVVNPGSVGMPFDAPGAYWAMVDGAIELRRTDYDREAAAEVLRQSPYPTAGTFVERHVLSPPTRAQMLDVYDRMAGAAQSG